MANVTTSLQSIPNLISNVRQGLIQLPEFQRNYVWDPKQKKELIDSILHSHPVGSFLEVELDGEEPLFAWVALKEIAIPEEKQYEAVPLPEGKSAPNILLLDGQQRLTTISHIIGGLGPKSWFLDTRKLEEYWSSEGSPSEGEELEKWIEGIDFSDYVSELKKKEDPFSLFGHKARRLSLEIFSDLRLFNQMMNDKMEKTTEIVSELAHKIKFHAALNISTPLNELDEMKIEFEKQRQFLRILQGMLNPVFNVEIPIVTVPVTMSVAGVCKIFTTINQTGQKLGSFDLIVASMYKYGIRLKSDWEGILNQHPKSKIIDGPNSEKKWILMTLALLNNKNPNPTKLAKTLVATDFVDNKLTRAASSFEEILTFIDSHFGTSIMNQGKSLISFRRALPVMAAAIHGCPMLSKENPGSRETWRKKLKCYYAAASVTNRFSTSSGTLQLNDYTSLLAWLNTNQFDDDMPPWLENFEPVSHVRLVNPQSSAAVNKFLLGLLNQSQPLDIHTNLPTAFSNTEQIPERHHIFPTAYLNSIIDPNGIMTDKELKAIRDTRYKSDSMLNRMIISKETNNQVIGERRPSVYLSWLEENGTDSATLKTRLDRAYIDSEGYNLLLRDDYDGFMVHRNRTILQAINAIAGITLIEYNVDEPEDEEPAEDEPDAEDDVLNYLEGLGPIL